MKEKFSSNDIRSATAAVTCSFVYGIVGATPRMSSLLFVASMTTFNIDRQQASFPFFLCYMIGNGFGPLIGYLGEKIGVYNTIFLGCLLSSISVGGCFLAENIVAITVLWGTAGVSIGMACVLLPQVLRIHFQRHLDKAVGITLGGESIASFLLTFLTEYFLKTYGLSGTFLLLSGVLMQSIPAALLIRMLDDTNEITKQNKMASPETVLKHDQNSKNEKSVFIECKAMVIEPQGIQSKVSSFNNSTAQKSDSKSTKYGFRVFLNPTYILIFLTQSSILYIFILMNTIIIDASKDHDVSVDDAVNILIGFQVADAVGRFTLGFFTDRNYLSKANFSAVCFAAIGLLLVAFIWLRGFAGLMIFSCGFGIFVGGLKMIGPSFVMQYVEKDCISVAIASRSTLYSPLGLTQAPLIGLFRDKLKNYDGLICILIAICCVSSFVSWIVPWTEKCRQKRKDRLQGESAL